MNGGDYLLYGVMIFFFGPWLLGALELIGAQSFWKIFYKIGIPVFKQTLIINTLQLSMNPNKVFRKKEGKFKFDNNNKIYFTSQMFLFNFRIHTPLPFKAIATIRDNEHVDIKAKVPLGLSLFFLSWLCGWTIGSILMSNLIFFLIGFGLVGVMIFVSYPLEKKRMLTMVNELQEIITEHNRS